MNTQPPKTDPLISEAIALLRGSPAQEGEISDAILEIGRKYKEALAMEGKSFGPGWYRDELLAPKAPARKLAKQLRKASEIFPEVDSLLNLRNSQGADPSQRQYQAMIIAGEWKEIADHLDVLADQLEFIEDRWPTILGRGTWQTKFYGNPKGRLAMDCLSVFRKWSPDEPMTGATSSFYKFVATAYQFASGGGDAEGEGAGLVSYVNEVATYHRKSGPLVAKLDSLRQKLAHGDLSPEDYELQRRSVQRQMPKPPYPLW